MTAFLGRGFLVVTKRGPAGARSNLYAECIRQLEHALRRLTRRSPRPWTSICCVIGVNFVGERPLLQWTTGSNGSIAPLRFLNLQTFDQLFMLGGVRNL